MMRRQISWVNQARARRRVKRERDRNLSPASARSPFPHRLGGVHGRLDDLVIAGAAADVARERDLDFILGRVRIPGEELAEAHQHAGRTVAALQSVVAMECGLPDAVTHIVATHAGEGNMVARTTEAWIVHHADFMSFEPFKNLV